MKYSIEELETLIDRSRMMLDGGEGEGEGDFTGEGDPAAGDQGGEGQSVPVNVVQAIRDEVKTLKEQNETLQAQVNLYQANPPQGGGGDAQAQSQGGGGGDAGYFKDRDDEDVITVGEMKQILLSERAGFQSAFGELHMAQSKSDYQTVITKHLPNVLKSNPALIEAIKTSKRPHVLAYELGKTDPGYAQSSQEATSQEAANRIKANAAKPGTASAAVSTGGGLSGVDYYANMSDDELEKKIEEVKSRVT